jgi:hypothetical protein
MSQSIAFVVRRGTVAAGAAPVIAVLATGEQNTANRVLAAR